MLGLQPTWTAGDGPIRNDDGAALEGDLFVFHEGGTYRTITADSIGLANSPTCRCAATRAWTRRTAAPACPAFPSRPAPSCSSRSRSASRFAATAAPPDHSPSATTRRPLTPRELALFREAESASRDGVSSRLDQSYPHMSRAGRWG